MSIHRSLVAKGSLVRSRNVLSRFERIEQLRKTGRWNDDEERSPYGLPKVRVIRMKKRGKEKKKKEEEATESTESTEASPAET